MGKLIDGDKLISTLVWGHYGLGKELQTVQKAIDDMRGVDAVPVIRCRECKHWDKSRINYNEHVCYWGGYVKREDDFCSWAERKEE